MTDKPDKEALIADATQIAQDAGYDFLIEYAARHIDWHQALKEHTPARFVATYEDLSKDGETVLKALKALGEVVGQEGYYAQDYLSRPALEKEIISVYNQKQSCVKHEKLHRAQKIAVNANYESLMAYAAGEVNWETNTETGKGYVAITATLNKNARVVLEALRHQGAFQPLDASDGLYANDFIARPELEKIIAEAQSGVSDITRLLNQPDKGEGRS